MVVGIIGILAAVAIPAYQNYQANARTGVVESILRTAQRTWKVEESLGRTISSLTGSHLWSKVESRDKGSFDDTASDFFSKGVNAWCLKISGKSTTEYEGFGGCVNNAGGLLLAGENKCSTASATFECAYSGGTGAWGVKSGCPNTCSTAVSIKPNDNTCMVDKKVISVSCTAGSAQDFYSLDIGDVDCTSGVCGS
ncbi:MAG: hypothetical protein ACR2M7_00535 [Bdellovibrionales bacterium]